MATLQDAEDIQAQIAALQAQLQEVLAQAGSVRDPAADLSMPEAVEQGLAQHTAGEESSAALMERARRTGGRLGEGKEARARTLDEQMARAAETGGRLGEGDKAPAEIVVGEESPEALLARAEATGGRLGEGAETRARTLQGQMKRAAETGGRLGEGDEGRAAAEAPAEAPFEDFDPYGEEPRAPEEPAEEFDLAAAGYPMGDTGAAPDQALLEQLFFDAHGGPFDPVSDMDEGKMKSIKELLASGQDFGDLVADDKARTRFALQLYRQ